MPFYIYSLTIHSVQFAIGQCSQVFFCTKAVNLFTRFHCLIYAITHIVYQFIPQALHRYPECLSFGIYFPDGIGASFPMNLSDDCIFHIPGNLTQQSFCSIVHICCTHDHLFFSVEHLPAREPIFYFLPAIPFRTGLCKAFRKNTASEARMIFVETRKGPALLNPYRHGTNFAG